MEAFIRRKEESHGATANRPTMNGVAGHLGVVSRDLAVERVTGIEPAQSACKPWDSTRHVGWSAPCQADVAPSAFLQRHIWRPEERLPTVARPVARRVPRLPASMRPAPSSAASRARSPARTRRVRPGTAPARHHLQAARAVQARTHHRPGGGGRRRRDMGENAVKQPAAVLRGHGRSAAARPRPARRADGGRRRTPRGSHDAAGPGENRSVKALRNGRDRRGGGLTATEQHVPIPLRTRLGACP
jgi:hypothetical protein